MSKVFTTSADFLNVAAAVVTVPPFTMHIWFKEAALGSQENLVMLGRTGTTNNRYGIEKGASDTAHAFQRDTTTVRADSTVITDTGWHAYTARFTTASLREIAVDGTNIGAETTAKTNTVPNALHVARDANGNAPATGLGAYLAIWNRALTDGEISSLFLQTPIDAAPSGLVGYYILLSDALDSAGSNNFTVNGAAGYSADMPVLGALAPAAGSLVITGKIPTELREVNVAPGVGAVRLSGFSVNSSSNIAVAGLGALTLSGRTITASIATGPSGAPDVGLLTVVGQIPTFKSNLIVSPSMMTGDADEDGLAPDVQWEWTSTIDVPVALIAQGKVPLLLQDNSTRVEPDVGLVTMGSLDITLDIPVGQSGIALAGAGLLQTAELAPDLLSEIVITPDPGLLQMSTLPLEGSLLVIGWHDSPPAESVTWS